jgi:hypothetical protein
VTAGVVIVGSLLFVGTLAFGRRVSGRWNALFRWVRIVAAGLVLLFGGAVIGCRLWAYVQGTRPAPEAVEEDLFAGITYLRDVREDPRPIVIHIVQVDLDAPGIEFLVTPGDPGEDRPYQAQRTSDFLDEYDLQVAINAGFYKPSHDVSPLDYFPHVGDRVEVDGDTSSQGVLIPTRSTADYRTLYLSPTNEVTFENSGEVYNAISGSLIFVERGEVGVLGDHPYITQTQPRTAVALDEQGRMLLLVVVDGRQPNYSEGVTVAELAQIVIDYGGYTALNLDGGGSVTLAVEGADGEPEILNSPIHNRIPGRERPVANHLGIYAQGN